MSFPHYFVQQAFSWRRGSYKTGKGYFSSLPDFPGRSARIWTIRNCLRRSSPDIRTFRGNQSKIQFQLSFLSQPLTLWRPFCISTRFVTMIDFNIAMSALIMETNDIIQGKWSMCLKPCRRWGRLAQRENTRFVILSFPRDCCSTTPHTKDFFQAQYFSFHFGLGFAMYFAQMLDITQPLSRERTFATIFFCVKGNVAHSNWPYDVTGHHISYYATLQTNTATYRNNTSYQTQPRVV